MYQPLPKYFRNQTLANTLNYLSDYGITFEALNYSLIHNPIFLCFAWW